MMNYMPSSSASARIRVAIAFSVATLTLGACASSSDLARSNPNYFKADISTSGLSGTYNPAGFKTAEVRDLLASNCKGKKLAGYSEKTSDGLTAFTATCQGGAVAFGGNMEFQRAGGQVISEGLLYDESGNISKSK
ncbi:hypothetical protein [Paracoccus sulfuroxidans]|uniref:Uncharacterized protein n=1 Tax=Paracoccus sulfuroxidans TaxID=384678 RepID=A0A562NGM6_9RHOB|nr:hypothetical protein [Paracoccus sulfuroxidans]TWI31238.1 hypothetical protein IQ24_03096 [Paracoccus sulfuroxidans]